MTASAPANKPQVKSYRMKTRSGNHIRVATMVVFHDGSVVRFTERMSSQKAIKQAHELYHRCQQ